MAEPYDFFTSPCTRPNCGQPLGPPGPHSVAEHVLYYSRFPQYGIAKEIEDECDRQQVNCMRAPSEVPKAVKGSEIEIYFPNTPPICLEISKRMKPGGMGHVTKPSRYDGKIAMGCTHWLFLDTITDEAYLMEMDHSVLSPSTAAECENMLKDKKNLIWSPGTPPSATKKPKSSSRGGTKGKPKPPAHMSQSHVMFPLINQPPARPSHDPSLPRVDPPDFERRMLDHLPAFKSDLLKSLTGSSGVSIPGPPILLVSDLERPLKEKFSNDEDTSTPIFPAAKHPELTYLLRYFSIVECVPGPFTKTGCTLYGWGDDLFRSLSRWIKDLEDSVANGDALMAITGGSSGGHDVNNSEHRTGMSTDFWGEPDLLHPKWYNHNQSMALALGFKESDHPDVNPSLTALAQVLMDRFPLLAREDGYTGLSPPYVLPASLTTTGGPDIVPISDLLSIKKHLMRASPAAQSDYATSRKPCSDYDGPPINQPKPWVVSVCDAMDHIFGPPTEKYEAKSLCDDAWPIDHVLGVLTDLQEQLNPIDAETKTRIFQSMLSTWKYVLPTAGHSFDKELRRANQAMENEGVLELERIVMTQRLRTEGIILLDLGKMRASAIDYLATRYINRHLVFMIHHPGAVRPPVEKEIERTLKYNGEDIVNQALVFLLISFFASAMKAMLAIGIDVRGRRAREPRDGTEFDIILDGLAMGHAVNLLAVNAVLTGATRLSPERILTVLEKGTKELRVTPEGEVVNGPPMWAIMQAIVTSNSTGVKENLDCWHQTLRRTESSDDTSLMAGIINDINGMRESPWKFFKNR